MISKHIAATVSGDVREGSDFAPRVASYAGPEANRERPSSKPSLVRNDLLHILDGLAREVSRPLASLRAGFHFALTARAGQGIPPDAVRCSTTAMADLCDQLLIETRRLMESVAMAELAETREVGSFPVSGIVVELEREFEPIAKARRIAFLIEQNAHDRVIRVNAEVWIHAVGGLIWDAINMTPSGGAITLRITQDRQACVFEVLSDSGRAAHVDAYDPNHDAQQPLPGPGSVIAQALLQRSSSEIRVIQASENCLRVAINYV